jgi:hypothetical protein
LLLVLALAACGSTPAPTTQPRVSLKLDAPDDGGSIRADKVQVTGTVTPADSQVQVAGDDAEVDGGKFTAQVDLQPGGNVIDVSASAPGHRPAVDAVRVVRDMRIEIPRLVGADEADAFSRLQKLGLKPTEQREDSWLDHVIPGANTVCDTDPGAGALVDKGATVTVGVARNCG